MTDWWTARSPRERVMLLVMLAIAIPILGWLLVARPLADARADARADYLLALDRHAQVSAMTVVTIHDGQGIGMPLTDFLAAGAGQRGFTLTVNSLEAPGRARIAISQASGQALLGWLAELEAAGLVLTQLQMVPGEAGGMSLSATISEPIS